MHGILGSILQRFKVLPGHHVRSRRRSNLASDAVPLITKTVFMSHSMPEFLLPRLNDLAQIRPAELARVDREQVVPVCVEAGAISGLP